jgi:hypothetical protein
MYKLVIAMALFTVDQKAKLVIHQPYTELITEEQTSSSFE